ncbi:hypothetical protein [Lysinibacillus sp. ZYM-1]|uniref:hypothetical protein n=1 Tax=Lysinibacillus sp. ZYM-1 TaxID=1681184 RepID=UPI0006CE6D8A|nr:hypothetical protein [Lysinibacillus sp. ZYM-1]KPN96292.1 hypothetical protein AO843_17830 [Lysinibacillus sp. ZYM-1]
MNNNIKKMMVEIKSMMFFQNVERLTAAFLLFSVLILGLYDSFTTGNIGVPLYWMIMTSVFNVIAREYYKRKFKIITLFI